MDKNKHQTLSSGLYLVSTPIGNMEDITLRALNILKKSNFILCEDTRRSQKLLSHFKIKNSLIAYHKFNEKSVCDKVINCIKSNEIVSLISDAGTPTVSDPGLVLVKRCIDENLKVHPIPGASAPTSAMSVSGFDEKYLFYGFLPKKEKELEKTIQKLKKLDFSIVFFVPSTKIKMCLLKFKDHFKNRKILIAKEMTKIYEDFIRGEVESIKIPSERLKGEFTVVISKEKYTKNIENNIDESVKINIKKMLKKYSLKDVVEFISKKENIRKKIVYDFCLSTKK